jgi:nucleoside-diphosphate-sugar epimerase
MNVLIIGGAGDVGSIVRPALESHHTCYYYDLRSVVGAEGRGYVADIEDAPLLHHAMTGMDAVVNLAMGVRPGSNEKDVTDINAVFNVNVRGCYRILDAAISAGVRRVVNASSLSVFDEPGFRDHPLDEGMNPDNWSVYGISKRLGETLCQAATQRCPDMGIVSLRLMRPTTAEDYHPRQGPWAKDEQGRDHHWYVMGPKDAGRLFLAALDLHREPRPPRLPRQRRPARRVVPQYPRDSGHGLEA